MAIPDQSTAPPPQSSPQVLRDVAIPTTVAGVAAVITPPAAAVVGALTVTQAVQATTRLLRALRGFQQARSKGFDALLRQEAAAQAPALADVIDSIISREMGFEVSFLANQYDRVQSALGPALAIADTTQRNQAVKAIFTKERRFTQMREEAMRTRVMSAIKHYHLEQASPQGAYWMLGKNVRHHTLDAISGGMAVDGPPLQAAARRWFVGELVEVELESGAWLSITPKHPVLTDGGWVAAGLLHEGDYLVRHLGGGALAHDDVDDVPALAEDVFGSLSQVGGFVRGVVPIGAEDFHGDGQDGYVHVVGPNSPLGDWRETALREHGQQRGLVVADFAEGEFLAERRASAGHAGVVAVQVNPTKWDARGAKHAGEPVTTDSVALAEREDGLAVEIGSENGGRNGLAMFTGAATVEPHRHGAGLDLELARKLRSGAAGQVAVDQIRGVSRRPHDGWVFDFSTAGRWYTVEGVIVSNCLAMAHAVWPWAVLHAFAPPVHNGCQCSLLSTHEAISKGLMSADQIPNPEAAIADATTRLRKAAQVMREGLDEEDIAVYLQEAAWDERYPKGTEFAGRFRPRVGGDAGALLTPRKRRALRDLMPDLHPLSRSTRGRWMWLGGRYVKVPHASAWQQRVGGEVYTSPAGTTNVSRAGALVSSPTPDAGRVHEVADRVRAHLRASRPPGVMPLSPGDGPSHVMSLPDRGFTPVAVQPRDGGWLLSHVNDSTGAELHAQLKATGVSDVGYDPAPIPELHAQAITHPPRSWGDFRQDAAAFAHEVAKRNTAPVRLRSFDSTLALADHAGNTQFDGTVTVGRDAPVDIERGAQARQQRRPLTDSELRGVYSAYWAMSHELSHTVNPLNADEYQGEGAALEEALAEEMSHVLLRERLAKTGQMDVLRWEQEHPEAIPVAGVYRNYRGALADMLDHGGVKTQAEREEFIANLKFRTPPADRFKALGELFQNVPEAEREQTARDWMLTSDQPRAALPQTRGTKSDSAWRKWAERYWKSHSMGTPGEDKPAPSELAALRVVYDSFAVSTGGVANSLGVSQAQALKMLRSLEDKGVIVGMETDSSGWVRDTAHGRARERGEYADKTWQSYLTYDDHEWPEVEKSAREHGVSDTPVKGGKSPAERKAEMAAVRKATPATERQIKMVANAWRPAFITLLAGSPEDLDAELERAQQAVGTGETLGEKAAEKSRITNVRSLQQIQGDSEALKQMFSLVYDNAYKKRTPDLNYEDKADLARKVGLEGKEAKSAKKADLIRTLVERQIGTREEFIQRGLSKVMPSMSSPGVYDYRITHTSPGPGRGEPLHAVTGDMAYPPDFYDRSTQARYYGSGGVDDMDRESFEVANRLRGKPNAPVKIYRAVPAGVSGINPGDWVTVSPKAAELNRDGLGADEPGRVLSRTVPAREVYTNGNSINEWGWHPPGMASPGTEPLSDRLFKRQLATPLDPEARAAVAAYGGNSHDINTALRQGQKPALTAALDRAFTPLSEDVTVHRAMRGEVEMPGAEVGSEHQLSGYTSTSLGASTMNRFGYGNADHLVLKVPAGTPTHYLGGYNQEDELLLGRNRRVHVDSIEPDPLRPSRRLIRAHVVADGMASPGTEEIPPEPGTTPVPKGNVRLWHYTGADADRVREQGLRIADAKGETYGEPNQIWASGRPPSFDNHNVVEFSVPRDDPRWDIGKYEDWINYGNGAGDPNFDYGKYVHDRNMNVTFRGDIRPDEILAVHEPWHQSYRYLMKNYPTPDSASPTEFDWALDPDSGGGPELAKAVALWKATLWPELAESIYTEVLHPRDRLGRWMQKRYGEKKATKGGKAGKKAKPYQPARWVDKGQDLPTMVHQAAELEHPDGTPDEHAEIVKAVLADKPPPKGASDKVKAATKVLRDASTPDGLRGRYLTRLHDVATDAHAGQVDKAGAPLIDHVEAVADSVSDDAQPVALLHDTLEHTHMTPEALRAALIEPRVTTPEQAQTMVDAVKLLTRDDGDSYQAHIEKIRTATGEAGELAREVKRAELQHNVGTLTPEVDRANPGMRDEYEAALKTLAPKRKPITQRGAPLNVNKLNKAVVMARLRKLYEASEKSGAAEVEKDWYQTAHDQIEGLARAYKVDPFTLAAMVAATSPQLEWRHEFKDGRIKFPNLKLALHAIDVARKYPTEPAPKLVDRLVEASTSRTKEERKLGPSELGGLGESVLKAIRIYRGEDPERVLNAPKTRSFANNLQYPDQETTVTMDEHMARAILGKGKKNYSTSTEGIFDEPVSGSGYTWAADVVKELAKEKHVMPHQAQAIIWTAQKAIADEIEAEEKAAAKAAKAAAKAKA